MGIRDVQGGWWHDCPPWMREMFGDDAAWHFWTPELLRRIAGAPHSAVPPPPSSETAELAERLNAWGPLLPLLHFHLGWQRIDRGLVNWARSDFETMDDPTLTVIRDQWGPALPKAVDWSARNGGVVTPPPMDRSWPGPGPAGLHLENHQVLNIHDDGHHWNAAYRVPLTDGRPGDLAVERRRTGTHGRLALILGTYVGWYRAVEEIGNSLGALPQNRSWQLDVTIAPIGYLGRFRRSRKTGRWFTGRHRAHVLGLDPNLSGASA